VSLGQALLDLNVLFALTGSHEQVKKGPQVKKPLKKGVKKAQVLQEGKKGHAVLLMSAMYCRVVYSVCFAGRIFL
jgi:hypothetical protein